MNDNQKIAAVCRALRAMRGYKQQELAERMDISQQTIRAIETGRSNAHRYVFKLCEATGVTLGEFDILMDVLVNSSRRLSP